MPDAELYFDEHGIAIDGKLRANDVEIDMRSNDMVAVLVSRAAIAPNAHPQDDQAVRVALLRALRRSRLGVGLTYAAAAAWVFIVIASTSAAVTHGGLGRWAIAAMSAAVVVSLLVGWWRSTIRYRFPSANQPGRQ